MLQAEEAAAIHIQRGPSSAARPLAARLPARLAAAGILQVSACMLQCVGVWLGA